MDEEKTKARRFGGGDRPAVRVVEVAKSRGRHAFDGEDAGDTLARRFERMIAVNAGRGYRLRDWKMSMIGAVDGVTETIVAVFDRIETPELRVLPLASEFAPAGGVESQRSHTMSASKYTVRVEFEGTCRGRPGGLLCYEREFDSVERAAVAIAQAALEARAIVPEDYDLVSASVSGGIGPKIGETDEAVGRIVSVYSADDPEGPTTSLRVAQAHFNCPVCAHLHEVPREAAGGRISAPSLDGSRVLEFVFVCSACRDASKVRLPLNLKGNTP